MIIDKLQEYLIKNEKMLRQAIDMDNKKWNNKLEVESLLEASRSIINRKYEISKKESKTYIVLYNGNPVITLTLAIIGAITNSNMIFMIYDNMLATNTIIVKMFEEMLEKTESKNFIKLYNNIKNEDIKKSMEFTNKIIFIGDKFEYQNVKRDFNIPVIYNGYGSVVIYTDNRDEFEKELVEIHNYAFENDITIDFYEGDLEENLEYINYDIQADTCAIFSKDENTINMFKKKVNSKNIIVNQNPFENYKFEFDIDDLISE